MKIELNVEKRYVFLIVAAILVFAGVVAIYAFDYLSPIPNPGHGADTVWVSIDGNEMTLQDAITTRGFGHTLGALNIQTVLIKNFTSYNPNGGYVQFNRVASCPSGYILLSGGCNVDSGGGSIPAGEYGGYFDHFIPNNVTNSYSCVASVAPNWRLSAYAYCASLD